MRVVLRPECYNASCEELRVSFGVRRSELLKVMRNISSCCSCLISSSMACRFTAISVAPLNPNLQCSCFQIAPIPRNTQHCQSTSYANSSPSKVFKKMTKSRSVRKENSHTSAISSQSKSFFSSDSNCAFSNRFGSFSRHCEKIPYCKQRIRGIFIPTSFERQTKEANSEIIVCLNGEIGVCEICKKSFRSTWGLKIHMKKLHALQKCAFCTDDFKLRSSLQNHLMTKHKVAAHCLADFMFERPQS